MEVTLQSFRKEQVMVNTIYNPFTFNPFGFHQDDEDPDYLIAVAKWQKENGLVDDKHENAPE